MPNQVPEGDEIPSVTPTEGASTNGFNVQATPNAFGADVASSISQVSQEAAHQFIDRQQLTNELMANDASTEYMKTATKLYGDFSQNEGKNAVAALPDFQNKLQKTWQDTIATMPSPEAKMMLDRGTRFNVNRYFQMGQNYADSQLRKWSDQSSLDKADEHTNQAALNVNDPPSMDLHIDAGANEIQTLAQHRGMDDDAASALVSKYKGGAVAKIADSLIATGNPGQAQQVLEKYKDQIDVGSRLAIQTRLKPILLDQQAQSEAQKWLTPGDTPNQAPAVQAMQATNYLNAVAHVESGNNPSAVNPGSGAFSKYQFMPATAHGLGISPQSSPADIDQAMVKFTDENRSALAASLGRPPTDPELYVAHAEGAAGAAALLKNPTLSAVDALSPLYGNDPSKAAAAVTGVGGNPNMTAGQLTGMLQQRLGGADQSTPAVGRSAVTGMKADTLEQISQHYQDNPQLGAKVAALVKTQFANAQMAELAAIQAQKEQQEKVSSGITADILQGKMQTTDAQGNPVSMIDNIAQQTRMGNLTSERAEQLSNFAEVHMKHTTDGDAVTYGPAFWDTFKRMNLPDSDPNKISNSDQIFALGNNGLTVSGVDKATALLKDKRQGPAGEAETTMMHTFLANAKGQISGADEGLGIKDPKGEQNFLRFQGQFFPALQAGKQAGKSVPDMLNPDSKDYLGKSIETFKRPMAQWMADIGASNTVPGMDAEAPKPDLTTREGVLAEYKAGHLPREAARSMLLKFPGVVGGEPVPVVPIAN